MGTTVNLYNLGKLPYAKAFHIQQVLFDSLKQSIAASSSPFTSGHKPSLPGILTSSTKQHHNTNVRDLASKTNNSLLLVEHEPVYTIGLRSKQYNDAYVSKLKEKLFEHNLKADFERTNRGGLITFHGPGQLIAYPILNLGDFAHTIKNRSVRAYVSLLESTIVDTLTSVGIKGAHTVDQYPGVWVAGGERKIAFVGITCKRYITMHGISINCNCDLAWFEHIVSCGIEDVSITSVQQELIRQEQDRQNGQIPPVSYISLPGRERNTCTSIDNRSVAAGDETPEIDADRQGISSARDGVDYISRAFCRSFSSNFKCNLVEERIS